MTTPGDNGRRPAHLRLPEHVRQDRDAQIPVRHPQQLERVLRDVSEHLLQDLRRIVLVPAGLEAVGGNGNRGQDPYGRHEAVTHLFPQPFEGPVIHGPDGPDVDDVADVLRFPLPDGQGDPEIGSLPGGAVDLHLSIVAGHEAVYDR